MLPSAPALAAPATKQTCPAERPDEAAALVTARVCGGDVKIAAQTNEYDQGIAQPNGQVRWEHHYRPVRIERNNAWIPTDTTLAVQPDGSVKPAATAVDLTFSGGGTGTMVTITEDGDTMRLGSPLGSLPKPVLDGAIATYQDVLPGIDMQLQADVDGYAQVLVVKNRTAAANPKLAQLEFPLSTSGLTVTSDSGGNLHAADAQGRVKLAGNAPEMWDASAQGATKTRLPLERGSFGRLKKMAIALSKSRLSVAPDQSMLADPNTVYPVYIDPGVTATRSNWTKVNSANPTTAYWNSTGTAQVGGTNVSSNKYRSFFDLNVGATPVAGKYINDANFNITQQYSLYCESHPVELWSTGYAGSSTTWNNQPTWSTRYGSVTSLAGCNSSNPAATITFNVTDHVQSAANGAWTDLTYGLRAPATDETGLRSYKEFNNNPYVTISYTAYATVTSKGTLPATVCATGSSRPYVNTTTPTLRVRVTDPEGAPVRPEIEWDTLAGAKIGSAQPLPGNASGSLFGATVPASAFTNGTSYSWKARGFDSTVWGPWASACEFTVDTTAPSVAPTVASTAYPAGQWGGGANTAGTFAFGAAGVSDVAAYEYGLDVNPPTDSVSPSAVGGSASVSVTPTADGPHTLYVRSKDRAGNVSPTTQYTFSVGSAAVTSPADGDTTAADVALTASAKASATGVTYQWRRGDADTWATIPAGDVTQAAGGTAVTWPFAGTGGSFAKLNWNTAKTINDAEAGADPLSGPLQIRAVLSDGSASSGISVTFDRNQASAESEDLGPGSVNLLTGNLTVTSSDVSVDAYGSDLNVSRSFNTRRAAEMDSAAMFGPGWVSGVVVENADAEYTQLDVVGSLVQVGLADGDQVGFTKRNATTFVPELGADDLKLTYTASPDAYKVTDSDGNATTFTRITGAPATRYFPTAVSAPGSSQTSTIEWEKVTVGGTDRIRPTRLLAPVAAGVSTCTPLAKGCRALAFSYAAATTATGTGSSAWGDFIGRIKEISFTAWDPDLATPAMRTVVMARYSYDDAGRLRAAWDPRLDWTDGTGSHHLQDSYGYDADGILSSIAPKGQEAWNFTYTTVPGDSGKGRLAKVSRTALAAGTATTTVVYNVPVAGGGAPYDLSAAQAARWGETEPPVRATAIFPPSQVPTGDQAAGTLPNSYERANITYLDANAKAVNTGTPEGSVTTTWYDKYGNIVRTLTPSNLDRAISQSQDDNTAEEADIAYRLSSVNVYSADGQRLTDAYGPEHSIVLKDDSEPIGRTHTHNVYDEGAPTTDNPYNLVTTSVTTVQYENNGVIVDAEATTTKTGYDWTLRLITSSTVDPGGLNLVTTTTYDSTTGLTTSITTPAGAGSTTTPSTRKTTYYRASTGSGYTECDNRAEWANLVCRVDAGGQPANGATIPATVTTYDIYNQPRTITEKSSSATLRTTTITFDGAGRWVTKTVTASGLGTAVPVARNVYDNATGQAIRTQSLVSGQVTAEVVRAYDTLGRPTSYTDADGATSTITYDLLSRPATSNDGKATRTYTYDSGNERRGLLTSVTDSQAGTFSADYDSDGQVEHENWPNGVAIRHYRDEAGQDYGVDYVDTNCSGWCTLYADWAGQNAAGKIRKESSDFNANEYQYDQAGRLVDAEQTTSAGCATRHYAFDDATNRTGISKTGPVAGDCADTDTTTARTSAYDTANRTTDAGYSYDALGRTQSVASVDTSTLTGNTTISYHTTDMVDTITQNGRTTDYTLDVLEDRVRSWTDTATGTTPHINHYDNDEDSPSWTQEGATSYTRSIASVNNLSAIYDSAASAVIFQIANLHGDVVATQDNMPGLASTSVTDEYGNPVDSTAGSKRYGWLGSKQRAADTPPGVILMGVRLYNPASGRFLQVDPVYGGNANEYEYCNADPVNCTDLSGRYSYNYTYYLGWNPFISSKRVMRMIKKHFKTVFVIPTNCKTLSKGKVCNLAGAGPVRVQDIWTNGWRFESLPGHVEGAGKLITFGLFRKGGRHYLNVIASGPNTTWCNKNAACRAANYATAWALWKALARKISYLI